MPPTAAAVAARLRVQCVSEPAGQEGIVPKLAPTRSAGTDGGLAELSKPCIAGNPTAQHAAARRRRLHTTVHPLRVGGAGAPGSPLPAGLVCVTWTVVCGRLGGPGRRSVSRCAIACFGARPAPSAEVSARPLPPTRRGRCYRAVWPAQGSNRPPAARLRRYFRRRARGGQGERCSC